MDYYTETNYFDHDELRTSGGKGRDDYFEAIRRTGLECIRIPTIRRSKDLSLSQRIRLESDLRREWDKALKNLGQGDTLVLHSPPSEKFLGFTGVIRRVQKRGCRIVAIVFDLETFFKSDYKRAARVKQMLNRRIEAALFRMADVIIVHNDRMKDKLSDAGFDASKMISVGVMDYIRDDEPAGADGRIEKDLPVVFCGNLDINKSGFVYRIPTGVNIDLYGPGFTGNPEGGVRYAGTFPSVELMDIMRGSFGLVWDGPSADTCTGACGEYLTFNNPHKMSLYLASGMPVIIWKEAALAEYVTEEGCGITIESLEEIPEKIKSLGNDEYEAMKQNAARVGAEMRKGIHIQRAVALAAGKQLK